MDSGSEGQRGGTIGGRSGDSHSELWQRRTKGRNYWRSVWGQPQWIVAAKDKGAELL